MDILNAYMLICKTQNGTIYKEEQYYIDIYFVGNLHRHTMMTNGRYSKFNEISIRQQHGSYRNL